MNGAPAYRQKDRPCKYNTTVNGVLIGRRIGRVNKTHSKEIRVHSSVAQRNGVTNVLCSVTRGWESNFQKKFT